MQVPFKKCPCAKFTTVSKNKFVWTKRFKVYKKLFTKQMKPN